MKKLAVILAGVLMLISCTSQADKASKNLSTAADQFEIQRRIIFINGITDQYLLVVEGRCSIEADRTDSQLEVTCKQGPNEFEKHFLGLSDNVFYIVEQLETANVSTNRTRILFRPQTILPDIDPDLP